jgi:Xaa-Pro aminopeptidase
VNPEVFKKRRKKLLQKLPKGSVAIIPAAQQILRNGDAHYPFRQDSSFFYYTGFREPNGYLVLVKADGMKEILFLRERDPKRELWDGKMLGTKKAVSHLLVDSAYPVESFEKELLKLFHTSWTLYIDTFQYLNVFDSLVKTAGKDRYSRMHFPTKAEDLSVLIAEQRLIKDQDCIKKMKMSSQINSLAHRKAMSFAKPGLFEYQVQALMKYVYELNGSDGEAYQSIVASGNNANTLHYIENDQKLKKGDLLLIDAGCEYHHYASDVTRTFPVSGQFSPEQKVVYDIVLKAQKACINMIKPGLTLSDLNKRAKQELAKGLIQKGILKGTIPKVIESDQFRQLYPHSLSHWLGIDVHDVGGYIDSQGKSIKLKPGMVITVEPGLYLEKSFRFVPKPYRGIGVRIEDDILVTSKGHLNLTADIPKEVAEIEKQCQQSFSYEGLSLPVNSFQ